MGFNGKAFSDEKFILEPKTDIVMVMQTGIH